MCVVLFILLLSVSWSEHKMTASPEAERHMYFSERDFRLFLLLYFFQNS